MIEQHRRFPGFKQPFERAMQRLRSPFDALRQRQERERQAELANAQRILTAGPTEDDVNSYRIDELALLAIFHLVIGANYDVVQAEAYQKAVAAFNALPPETHRERTIRHAQGIIQKEEARQLKRTGLSQDRLNQNSESFQAERARNQLDRLRQPENVSPSERKKDRECARDDLAQKLIDRISSPDNSTVDQRVQAYFSARREVSSKTDEELDLIIGEKAIKTLEELGLICRLPRPTSF